VHWLLMPSTTITRTCTKTVIVSPPTRSTRNFTVY
jgi:hypothetical protein